MSWDNDKPAYTEAEHRSIAILAWLNGILIGVWIGWLIWAAFA